MSSTSATVNPGCDNRLTRRTLVTAGAAIALAGASRRMADPLQAAAREAWLYGLPLIEMAGQRSSAARRNLLNAYGRRRGLLGPEDRAVTAPNNDTLFSSSFLDLRSGPLRLHLPATGERYQSLALMDMFTNNFAVLAGGEARTVTLAGPRGRAPPGAIRAPTPWVWALGRTLVASEADLPAARGVQDGLRIQGPTASSPADHPGRQADWRAYFSAVQALIDENPPRRADAPFFRRIAALGLGPGRRFDAARFSAEEAGLIEAGVAEARVLALRSFRAEIVDGWSYPDARLGDFGADYHFRANVALTGLAALPPREAIYMQPVDANGSEVLDLTGPMLLRFPPGRLPPVGAFWSLTMYEVTREGQYFLTPNVLNRYSIGDRTPGLAYGPDGSLEIWISRTPPPSGRTTNWLPAPAAGPCRLSLRAYRPRPALLSGAYRLPPLVPAVDQGAAR